MHHLTSIINHAFFAGIAVLTVWLAYHEVKSYRALKRRERESERQSAILRRVTWNG